MSTSNKEKGWEFIKDNFDKDDVTGLEYFNKIFPDFVETATVEYAFGTLWQREILDNKTRELIVLTTLITQGCVDEQLRFHARLALKFGMTIEEIKEVVLLLSAYIGIPKAIKALGIMREVLEPSK